LPPPETVTSWQPASGEASMGFAVQSPKAPSTKRAAAARLITGVEPNISLAPFFKERGRPRSPVGPRYKVDGERLVR
jgi:hypothetical protein